MSVLDTVTSYSEVEDLIVGFALRIQAGEQLSEDEQTDYMDAASYVVARQFMARGYDVDDALDLVEAMLYDENGDSREVTVSVRIIDGELAELSLKVVDE